MLHRPTANQLEALGFHGMAKALAEQINDKAALSFPSKIASPCSSIARPPGARPSAISPDCAMPSFASTPASRTSTGALRAASTGRWSPSSRKGRWIDDAINLLVTGATGAGKTWIACAFGHKACRDNRPVLYARVPRLMEELAIARADGRYPRLLTRLAKVKLLILDDWAITPMTAEQRRDLLEIVEDRCGRASTIIASQIPIADWHSAIGDTMLAGAILDRLVHNAYRIELKGDSMRKNNAKIRQQT